MPVNSTVRDAAVDDALPLATTTSLIGWAFLTGFLMPTNQRPLVPFSIAIEGTEHAIFETTRTVLLRKRLPTLRTYALL